MAHTHMPGVCLMFHLCRLCRLPRNFGMSRMLHLLSMSDLPGMVCDVAARSDPCACTNPCTYMRAYVLLMDMLGGGSGHLVLHAVHLRAHADGGHLHLVLQVGHLPEPV